MSESLKNFANVLVKQAEGAAHGATQGGIKAMKEIMEENKAAVADGSDLDRSIPPEMRFEVTYRFKRKRTGGPGRASSGSFGSLASNVGEFAYQATPSWAEECKEHFGRTYGWGTFEGRAYNLDGKPADAKKFPNVIFSITEDEAENYGYAPAEARNRLSLSDGDSDAPVATKPASEAISQLAEIDLEIKKEEKRIALEETKAEGELRRRSLEKKLSGQDDKVDKEKERDVREAQRERERALEEAARAKAEAEAAKLKAEMDAKVAEAKAEALVVKTRAESEARVESERLRAETASLRNEVNSKFEALIAHLNRPAPPPPPPPPPLDIAALLSSLTPMVNTLAQAASSAFQAMNAKIDKISERKQPDMLELLKAAKDIVAPTPVTTQQTKLSELRDLVEVAKGLMPPPPPQVDPMEQLSRSFEMIQMAKEMALPPEDKPEENTAVSIIKAVGGAVSQAARETGLVNVLAGQPPQPPPGYPPGVAMIPHPQAGQQPQLTPEQAAAIRAQQARQQPQQPGTGPVVPPAPAPEPVLTPKELGEVAALITDAINNGKPAKDVIARLKKKYPAAIQMLRDAESPEALERDLTEAAGVVGDQGPAVMMLISALKTPAGNLWAIEAASELDL